MTIQRERLNRKNAGGSYDTIHLETQADLVLMTGDPSKNVEQVLGETVSIARGGTGATTAAAGLYALANDLPLMSSDDLAEDDCICFVDVASSTAKKVTLKTLGASSGGTEPPVEIDWVTGNTIHFGGYDWIIIDVQSEEVWCMATKTHGMYAYDYLPTACNTFLYTIPAEDQQFLLPKTEGNTTGKVWVISYDLLTILPYTQDRSNIGCDTVWLLSDIASSGSGGTFIYGVERDGEIKFNWPSITTGGFRPFIAINRTLYESSALSEQT